MHWASLLHGDVRPQNLLVCSKDQEVPSFKLGALGGAFCFHDCPLVGIETGSLLGSPAYLSPEFTYNTRGDPKQPAYHFECKDERDRPREVTTLVHPKAEPSIANGAGGQSTAKQLQADSGTIYSAGAADIYAAGIVALQFLYGLDGDRLDRSLRDAYGDENGRLYLTCERSQRIIPWGYYIGRPDGLREQLLAQEKSAYKQVR